RYRLSKSVLADDMLALGGCGHGHLAVGIAGGGDIDQVDGVTGDSGLPIRGGLLAAEETARDFGLFRVAPHDDLHLDLRGVGKEHVYVAIRLAMGLAHELGAKKSYAYGHGSSLARAVAR